MLNVFSLTEAMTAKIDFGFKRALHTPVSISRYGHSAATCTSVPLVDIAAFKTWRYFTATKFLPSLSQPW
jgi:hypothetical protein